MSSKKKRTNKGPTKQAISRVAATFGEGPAKREEFHGPTTGIRGKDWDAVLVGENCGRLGARQIEKSTRGGGEPLETRRENRGGLRKTSRQTITMAQLKFV